jgi:hypothetical protein
MLLAPSFDPATARPPVSIPRTRLPTDFAGPNRLLSSGLNEFRNFIRASVHWIKLQAADLLFDLKNLKWLAFANP